MSAAICGLDGRELAALYQTNHFVTWVEAPRREVACYARLWPRHVHGEEHDSHWDDVSDYK